MNSINTLLMLPGNTFKCILILLVYGLPLVAQEKEKFGELTAFQKEFTSYEKDTTTSAVYLYEYGDNYFEVRDGYIWLITKYHAKIKILKREGFDYAKVEIPLYRSKDRKEKLVSVKAITHNDKVVSGVKKAEFFTEEVNEKWSETKFTFPKVREGSIVEYEYEMQSPFYFNFTGWNFQSDIPKIYSEFNAKIPGNWVYNRSLIGYLKLDVNEAEILKGCFEFPGVNDMGQCEELKYVMKDVPAFKENENYMLSPRNYRSKIEFELSEYNSFYGGKERYTKSWEDVDKEFKTDKDIGSQLRKKNFFEKNVDEKLLTDGDEITRAKNIFEYVKNNFVWNEEYGIWQDNRVKDAFEKKKGNVAELNIILINLLNAAEIKADMMLLATRNRGLPKKTHPVMSDFNYLIAKINIDGEDYLLDATEKRLPFGMLPYRCLNYYGRVMDFDKESYWFDIIPESSNGKSIRAQMRIDSASKTLTGVLDIVNLGYMKISQEEALTSMKEDEYLNQLEQEISDDFHIISHEKKEKYSNEKRLTERFEFEIENLIQGDNIYLNPFVVKFFDKNPFVSSERHYPIDFGHNIKYQYILNVKMPEGYKLNSLPQDKNFTLPGNGGIFKLNLNYDVKGGITLFFLFELNSPHFVSEYYDEIKNIFAEAVNSQNQSFIVLEKI